MGRSRLLVDSALYGVLYEFLTVMQRGKPKVEYTLTIESSSLQLIERCHLNLMSYIPPEANGDAVLV